MYDGHWMEVLDIRFFPPDLWIGVISATFQFFHLSGVSEKSPVWIDLLNKKVKGFVSWIEQFSTNRNGISSTPLAALVLNLDKDFEISLSDSTML